MIEIDRKIFKRDPVFRKLWQEIKRSHKVADHTKKVLSDNKHIKDFCEEARHFAELPGKDPIYIHYDVSSWYRHPKEVVVRIESIGLYDNFLEYETARLKGIHSTKDSTGDNLT